MKAFIKKAVGGAAIVLATAAVTAWAANITKYEKLSCGEGGYGDAYLVTEIDPSVGCILSQYGIGCNGEPFRHDFLIQSRPSDLGMPFDYQYSGATVSGTWYVKVDYHNGAFVRAWGKKADGTYYEATL